MDLTWDFQNEMCVSILVKIVELVDLFMNLVELILLSILTKLGLYLRR